MSEDKRKRCPNWLASEKELLLNLVELHYDVIENKKTDGAAMKTKLAQWHKIANQYNSETTHGSRRAENLKAQWESMKKVARKEAAIQKQHPILSGAGSSKSVKKDDNFPQRVLSLISSSAFKSYNRNDTDSLPPQAVPSVSKEILIEPPAMKNISPTPVMISIIKNEKISDIDVDDAQDLETMEEGGQGKKEGTPVAAVQVNNVEGHHIQKDTPPPLAALTRRPAHTATTVSIEQLRKNKNDAIELSKKLALQGAEMSKTLHDLNVQIKREIIRQERIKTSILQIRRSALKKRT